MACETTATCEVIGRAVIGINLKIGCSICPIGPIFDPNARRTCAPGKIEMYRDKFRNHGMITK